VTDSNGPGAKTPRMWDGLVSKIGEENRKIFGLFIVALLALIFLTLAHYMLAEVPKFDYKVWLLALATVFLTFMVALTVGTYLAKIRLIGVLDSSFSTRLQEFEKEYKSTIAALSKVLETCIQLKELMKEGREWLIDDQIVFELESKADEEISVLVPDFHYEFQARYLEVIVNNLKNPEGPTYRYFVLWNLSNEQRAKDLRQRIRSELVSAGIENPDQLMSQRFNIVLLDEKTFPEPVLYGLAIYQHRDGSVRCLQYLPRELGTMNINIPVGTGTVGSELVDRNRAQLRRWAEMNDSEATVGRQSITAPQSVAVAPLS